MRNANHLLVLLYSIQAHTFQFDQIQLQVNLTQLLSQNQENYCLQPQQELSVKCSTTNGTIERASTNRGNSIVTSQRSSYHSITRFQQENESAVPAVTEDPTVSLTSKFVLGAAECGIGVLRKKPEQASFQFLSRLRVADIAVPTNQQRMGQRVTTTAATSVTESLPDDHQSLLYGTSSTAISHSSSNRSEEALNITMNPAERSITHRNESSTVHKKESSLSMAEAGAVTSTAINVENQLSRGVVLKLVIYYFALYFFTVVYNISNKFVLNRLPLPATLGAVQLLIGIPLFTPLWLIKPPTQLLRSINFSTLVKVAVAHALGNLATIYALASGNVSFTHVVKAAEPIFSSVLSAILLGSVLHWKVYIMLIPIVVGVAIASAEEVSFTWFAFLTAMTSNFFYQLRYVLSKKLITPVPGSSTKKVSAANLFRVVTVGAVTVMLPISLMLEVDTLQAVWQQATPTATARRNLLLNIFISGVSYYLYNEIAFWILDLVHPVTHAVGNTIKRVVLIIASVIIFQVPVNIQGALGAAVAILGSFGYAYAQHRQQSQ